MGCLLGIAVLALALYAGLQWIGDEFDYQAMHEETRRQAGLGGELTDEEIRQELVRQAVDLGLPPSARDIRIDRLPGGSMSVSLRYADTLSLFDRWSWVRTRSIDVRERY